MWVVSDQLGKILEKLANPIAKYRYQSVKEVIQELNILNQPERRSPSQILPPLPPLPPVSRRSQVSPPPPQPSVTVSSRYERLEKLLAAGEWKEADEETAWVMLAVAKREKEGFLDTRSI
jgi:hypothetical protein